MPLLDYYIIANGIIEMFNCFGSGHKKKLPGLSSFYFQMMKAYFLLIIFWASSMLILLFL